MCPSVIQNVQKSFQRPTVKVKFHKKSDHFWVHHNTYQYSHCVVSIYRQQFFSSIVQTGMHTDRHQFKQYCSYSVLYSRTLALFLIHRISCKHHCLVFSMWWNVMCLLCQHSSHAGNQISVSEQSVLHSTHLRMQCWHDDITVWSCTLKYHRQCSRVSA